MVGSDTRNLFRQSNTSQDAAQLFLGLNSVSNIFETDSDPLRKFISSGQLPNKLKTKKYFIILYDQLAQHSRFPELYGKF